MGRMYTLDKKLLCGSPEIRIGDKCYPVDDRTSTVRKAMKMYGKGASGDDFDRYEETLKLALGSNYKEVAEMDMPFPAFQKLVEAVIALMTGAEVPEEGFRPAEEAQ